VIPASFLPAALLLQSTKFNLVTVLTLLVTLLVTLRASFFSSLEVDLAGLALRPWVGHLLLRQQLQLGAALIMSA
jgi:hypothetical protein